MIPSTGTSCADSTRELRPQQPTFEPYADGFAAALALQPKASLATSDKYFAHIEKKLDILWTVGP
jgi:hypothetical protein